MKNNELLLAISNIIDIKFDEKLNPIKSRLDVIESRLDAVESRLTRIEVDLLENNIIPRMNTIESCYTSTYNRYKENVDKMETTFTDIELMKGAITEHSVKLQKIS